MLEKYTRKLDIYQQIYNFIYSKYFKDSTMSLKNTDILSIKIKLDDPILLIASRPIEEVDKIFNKALLELLARDSSLLLDGKKVNILSTILDEDDFNYIFNAKVLKNIKSRNLILPDITKEELILNLQYFYFSLAEMNIKVLAFEKFNLNEFEFNAFIMDILRDISKEVVDVIALYA